MKTALVHDWLLSHGGAEEVLQAIYGCFPGDIYTLGKKPAVVARYGFPESGVFASFIEQLPFSSRFFKHYLPLFPRAIEQFDLSEYDLVLSSSHCVAKGALTHHEQLHICYCHSPMRYAWDLYHTYLRDAGLTKGLKGWLAQGFLHTLRQWDVLSAQRVDHFIANSQFIARRIRKIYGREATVIYPPVNTEQFSLVEQKEDFYLTASRLVPYKRIDIIIEAFNAMPEKKLVVIGSGEQLEQLRALAKPNITLLGFVETDEMVTYMQRAKGFVFAALEDFGILPVEAQSCGTPVLCLGRGGTKETCIDGKTGVHFAEQSKEALIAAVKRFETLSFDPEAIHAHARSFSTSRFTQQFTNYVHRAHEAFSQQGSLIQQRQQ